MENKAPQMNASEPVDWIDNLRVMATISVVFLYVSAPLTAKFGNILNTLWMITFIFSSCLSTICLSINFDLYL